MVHQLSPLDIWGFVALFVLVLSVAWFGCQWLIRKLWFCIDKWLLLREIDRGLRVLRDARDQLSPPE